MKKKSDSPEASATPMKAPEPIVADDQSSQLADAERQGRQIPGYQILAKIGAGAMAVVFKARQISLDRIVAIKVMPKKLSADPEYVERFYREGQAAAKLNHANIVQAFDVGQAHGYHYFVMEYVEGKTVYEELAAGKVFSEARALDIAIQIAQALVHAHELGLIHRDVKPKNIMITPDGVAKLMDMGLARVADDAKAIAAEAGRLFGTPYYISPEQILGRGDVDFRCDIYGLGATLYHMITGRVPFDGKDSKEVMIRHVRQELVSPERYNLDLSFGICKVVRKMLAKAPADRHGSTQELLEDLQSVDFLLEAEAPTDDIPGLSGLAQHIAPDAPGPKPASTNRASQATTDITSTPDQAKPIKKLPLPLLIALAASVLLNILLLLLLL